MYKDRSSVLTWKNFVVFWTSVVLLQLLPYPLYAFYPVALFIRTETKPQAYTIQKIHSLSSVNPKNVIIGRSLECSFFLHRINNYHCNTELCKLLSIQFWCCCLYGKYFKIYMISITADVFLREKKNNCN